MFPKNPLCILHSDSGLWVMFGINAIVWVNTLGPLKLEVVHGTVSLRSNLELPSGSASSGALPLPPVSEGDAGAGEAEDEAEETNVTPECARLIADGKKRIRAYTAKIKELDSLKDTLKDKKSVQQDCN